MMLKTLFNDILQCNNGINQEQEHKEVNYYFQNEANFAKTNLQFLCAISIVLIQLW